ncbi:hypothetical protein [Streptomyces vastus]|uniref:hypothetical protein n=1 Tax=Streptomyces vastus TaxID=285451 RepID=UPI0031DB1F23
MTSRARDGVGWIGCSPSAWTPPLYGELVLFGEALPWYGGTPPAEQGELFTP